MIIKAKWIKSPISFPKSAGDRYGNPSPYFRKKFSLDKEVKSAKIYYSAIGVLKVYINGMPIDDDYMSPGFTDYRTRIPVLEKDITNLLSVQNAIGIVAGDGWAVGYMGNNMERCAYSDTVFVMAQIEINYLDGTSDFVLTDTDWKVSTGEIIRSDNYMGEFVDKNFAVNGFSRFDFDDSKWNYSLTVPYQIDFTRIADLSVIPPIKVKHILKPVFMHRDSHDRLIYDFNQNFAGVVCVKLKGQKHSQVTIRHGEMLEKNGDLYTENLRLAEAKDICILSGNGEETFRPLFTFHGFRYIEVEILGEADIIDIEGQVLYTDLKKCGDFSCSDDTVNKLYSNIVWSQRSNFLSVPTDCPQRDERLGWAGDAQIFATSAMFNMNCKSFYEKYVSDLRDAQAGNGGVGGIAPIVPTNKWYYFERENYSAGWGDAIVIIPYEHYLMYGDKSILYKTVSSMKCFIEYCLLRSENYLRPADDNYGDWLSVGDSTDLSVISTLYFAYSTLILSKILKVIGDFEYDKYFELYNNIKSSFIKNFVNNDFVIKSDSQTAYLLAYKFGILTKEQIKSNLLRKIKEKNYHITCGFLGVKYMLPVLCEIGESSLAYRLLTNKSYPSWCFSVVNGATTIWERWNSWTKKDGFADRTMNSFNHYSLGSCSEWFFKYCLGINYDENYPAFSIIKIKPFVDFSGKITNASGYYEFDGGKIDVKWELINNQIIYNVIAPKNTKINYDFSCYSYCKQIDQNTFLLRK